MKFDIIEPNYFKDFHCIGGECKQNCCSCSWNISFNKKEYLAIKNAKKSKELQELCTYAFRRIKKSDDPNVYAQMRMTEEGNCHFLGNDGLCLLQKECGYKVLPYVCRSFPRCYSKYLNTTERYLSSGCEVVVRLLMELSDGIELTNNSDFDNKSTYYSNMVIDSPQKANSVPYKYYWDIRTLTISIMKNRSYSVEDRLILLGIAFKHIDELISANNGDKLPAYIDGLIAACADDKSMLDEIRNIEPKTNQNAINFANMLKAISTSLVMPKDFLKKIKSAYNINYNESTDPKRITITIDNTKIEKQLGFLFNMISGREYIIENFMLNTMLYLNLPFTNTSMSFWDSYIFICQIYSLMIFILAGNMTETSDDNDIIEAFVIFSRCLFHNKHLREALLKHIKKEAITSLGSMVYLIKF